jgi:hypothetical protein
MADNGMKNFVAFQKFEYSQISKPGQSFLEKIKYANKIFFKYSYKTTYVRDLTHLISNPEIQGGRRKILKRNKLFYDLLDIPIVIYGIHSIYWHNKHKYFLTGRKWIEVYIMGKIVFTMIALSYLKFFIFKEFSDPVLFEYYNVKEEEWEQKRLTMQNDRKYLHEIEKFRKDRGILGGN